MYTAASIPNPQRDKAEDREERSSGKTPEGRNRRRREQERMARKRRGDEFPELHEIETEGGGLEEKTAFVKEQVDVVLKLNNPRITESYLTVLGNLNVSNNHAFDEQILRLYDKLGVQSISITNNHYAEGSNNQVFNGMIKDSSIISK